MRSGLRPARRSGSPGLPREASSGTRTLTDVRRRTRHLTKFLQYAASARQRILCRNLLKSKDLTEVFREKSRRRSPELPTAGVSFELRGLITWQWAPDRRPARQAGQLLSLTRLGSTFQTGRSATLPSRIDRFGRASRAGRTCACSGLPGRVRNTPTLGVHRFAGEQLAGTVGLGVGVREELAVRADIARLVLRILRRAGILDIVERLGGR